MKKLILIALAAVMIAGCIKVNSRQKEETKTLDIYGWGTTYYTPNGCEYYIYNNYHSGIPIHKQDCKKCQQRREKEIERLLNF
jgi:hypothetical protein